MIQSYTQQQAFSTGTEYIKKSMPVIKGAPIVYLLDHQEEVLNFPARVWKVEEKRVGESGIGWRVVELGRKRTG